MALTPVPLEDEGFDRAFETASGTRFRVRVRQTFAEAPTSNAAPTRITLTVTLALLDQENTVQRLGDGYRIFDPHEATPDFSSEGFDIEAMILKVISDAAAKAERDIANQAAAHDYLSGWGITPTLPPVVEPEPVYTYDPNAGRS